MPMWSKRPYSQQPTEKKPKQRHGDFYLKAPAPTQTVAVLTKTVEDGSVGFRKVEAYPTGPGNRRERRAALRAARADNRRRRKQAMK